jgi:SAM-dependent methyltransferase
VFRRTLNGRSGCAGRKLSCNHIVNGYAKDGNPCVNCLIGWYSMEEPSPWIVKNAPLIPKEGRVLDLACGYGRHAVWLTEQGYRVDAIDRDARVVSGLLGLENISVLVIDLEAGVWPQSDQRYDGLVVSRYLYRPLLHTLASMLNPGGVLIYETFMVGNERYGKPSNPDYLLRRNELLETYLPLLNIISFEQGEERQPRPSVMQRICAGRLPFTSNQLP